MTLTEKICGPLSTRRNISWPTQHSARTHGEQCLCVLLHFKMNEQIMQVWRILEGQLHKGDAASAAKLFRKKYFNTYSELLNIFLMPTLWTWKKFWCPSTLLLNPVPPPPIPAINNDWSLTAIRTTSQQVKIDRKWLKKSSRFARYIHL